MVLADLLADVFFHAHHTGSTRMPKLAVHTEWRLAKFGNDIIPYLYRQAIDADSESASYFGQTLAKIGLPALEYILSSISTISSNDNRLVNVFQVLSYFTIKQAVEAIPVMLNTDKVNHQVTAMSFYAIGRIVQKVKSEWIEEILRTDIFNTLYGNLSHDKVLVRKNAARSLGKMLRKGVLNDEQKEKLHKAFLTISGRDENHSWDRDFIVRREVEDFLPYFDQHRQGNEKYNQTYKILSKKYLAPNTFQFTIHAPWVAHKIEAGQFIIVRPHIFSERIPLSIAGWNREAGTINIIVFAVGKTTTEINSMPEGKAFQDLVGPLGNRSEIPENIGTCVVIGGGYGTGAILPTALEMKNVGHKVIGIVGARNSENLIMVNELKATCDEIFITTNDGSSGMQGLVTDALKIVMDREPVMHVLAIGPVPMMKAVSELTKPQKISTHVSLNAIMVDGTGMCGACRVTVGEETKFACFHGPDFNGHLVDFENLVKRQKMFVKQERMANSIMNN
jgi:ferredoxin--NADP+ reductase